MNEETKIFDTEIVAEWIAQRISDLSTEQILTVLDLEFEWMQENGFMGEPEEFEVE